MRNIFIIILTICLVKLFECKCKNRDQNLEELTDDVKDEVRIKRQASSSSEDDSDEKSYPDTLDGVQKTLKAYLKNVKSQEPDDSSETSAENEESSATVEGEKNQSGENQELPEISKRKTAIKVNNKITMKEIKKNLEDVLRNNKIQQYIKKNIAATFWDGMTLEEFLEYVEDEKTDNEDEDVQQRSGTKHNLKKNREFADKRNNEMSLENIEEQNGNEKIEICFKFMRGMKIEDVQEIIQKQWKSKQDSVVSAINTSLSSSTTPEEFRQILMKYLQFAKEETESGYKTKRRALEIVGSKDNNKDSSEDYFRDTFSGETEKSVDCPHHGEKNKREALEMQNHNDGEYSLKKHKREVNVDYEEIEEYNRESKEAYKRNKHESEVTTLDRDHIMNDDGKSLKNDDSQTQMILIDFGQQSFDSSSVKILELEHYEEYESEEFEDGNEGSTKREINYNRSEETTRSYGFSESKITVDVRDDDDHGDYDNDNDDGHNDDDDEVVSEKNHFDGEDEVELSEISDKYPGFFVKQLQKIKLVNSYENEGEIGEFSGGFIVLSDEEQMDELNDETEPSAIDSTAEGFNVSDDLQDLQEDTHTIKYRTDDPEKTTDNSSNNGLSTNTVYPEDIEGATAYDSSDNGSEVRSTLTIEGQINNTQQYERVHDYASADDDNLDSVELTQESFAKVGDAKESGSEESGFEDIESNSREITEKIHHNEERKLWKREDMFVQSPIGTPQGGETQNTFRRHRLCGHPRKVAISNPDNCPHLTCSNINAVKYMWLECMYGRMTRVRVLTDSDTTESGESEDVGSVDVSTMSGAQRMARYQCFCDLGYLNYEGDCIRANDCLIHLGNLPLTSKEYELQFE